MGAYGLVKQRCRINSVLVIIRAETESYHQQRHMFGSNPSSSSKCNRSNRHCSFLLMSAQTVIKIGKKIHTLGRDKFSIMLRAVKIYAN